MIRMIIGMSLWYCIQNYDTASGTDYRKRFISKLGISSTFRERESAKRENERKKKGWRVIRFIPLYAFISEIFPLLTASWIKHAEWDSVMHETSTYVFISEALFPLSVLTVFKAVDYIDLASLSPGKDRIVNECALGGWGEVEGLGWFH